MLTIGLVSHVQWLGYHGDEKALLVVKGWPLISHSTHFPQTPRKCV